jgi:predicted DNA-binding helix-hairpin-helix protein
MEFEKKLDILGSGARYDLSCACGESPGRRRGPLDRWIYPAVLPGGGTAPLLKILQTNVCEKGCHYCENRSGRDFRRATFGPEELASGFMELFTSGRVMGLFLSSALSGSAVRAMDRMIAAAEILRRKHRYRGYLHLKILPGAQEAQVERAGALATRVSVNLEVPGREYLGVIAPDKRPQEILGPLQWIRKYSDRKRRGWAPSGFTTQFVVGAAGETDREILRSAGALYKTMGARRIYFSAFQPVPQTPLESAAPCALWREHRLYQCDFLIRRYGFGSDEIVFDERGNLFAREDPKTSWARRHPEIFPLEVNRAPLELLLRVPGIGPVTAERITEMRRETAIRSPEQLAVAGASVEKVAPYLLLSGRAVPRQVDMELGAPSLQKT